MAGIVRELHPKAASHQGREPVNMRRPSGVRPWEEIFVPRRYRGLDLVTFPVNEQNEKVYRSIWEYIRSFSEFTSDGLLLAGTVGTGKTGLLFAVGQELALAGYWPKYRNFAKVCIELKGVWSRRESDAEIKEPLLTHSPLLLDDLGAEKRDREEQGWVSELVYEIIETRYENMLATIIATNLNLDDIAERYTDRVASRLAEMCQAYWIEGYDLRLPQTDSGIGE